MYFHIPYPLWVFSSALTVFSWDIKEGLSLTDDTESALIRTCIGTVLLYLRDINSYILRTTRCVNKLHFSIWTPGCSLTLKNDLVT